MGYLTLVLGALAAFFVAKGDEIPHRYSSIEPVDFLAPVFLTIGGILVQAVTWAVIQRSLGAGARIPRVEWLYAFLMAQIGKYAPGKIWVLVGRFIFLERHGFNRIAVIGATLIENIMFFLAALALGSFFLLPIATAGSDATGLFREPWLIAGVVLAFVVIATPCFDMLLRAVSRWQALSDWPSVLSLRRRMAYFGLSCISHLLYGLSLLALISATADEPLSLSNSMLVVASYPLACALGVVAVFAPSGIGVREAVFVFLYVGFLEPAASLVSVLSFRLLTVLAELLLLASVAIIRRGTLLGMPPR